jgi:hypothetical protein
MEYKRWSKDEKRKAVLAYIEMLKLKKRDKI